LTEVSVTYPQKNILVSKGGAKGLPAETTNVYNPNEISIGVMTWNMAETSPLPEHVSFLNKFKDCDLVVLGVQETENIKPRREDVEEVKSGAVSK